MQTYAPPEEQTGLRTLLDQIIFLKQVPLFANLKLDELSLMANIVNDEVFPDEAVIIKKGSINQALFIIVSGCIEISASAPDGSEGTLAVLKDKDSFGESGVFNAAPSPVTAQVIMGEARLLSIPGEDLKRLIRLYPEIGLGFLAAAAQRLDNLQRLAASLG
jgi:CRP-like cAMP-binding protein